MNADIRSPSPDESREVQRIPGSRRRGECILPFHDPYARLAREFTVPTFDEWEDWDADPVARRVIDDEAGA